MSDLISREAAIDALGDIHPLDYNGQSILEKIKSLPSTEEMAFNEWCTDCKEYDREKGCCPRFNRVIEETVKEVREEHQGKHGRWIIHPEIKNIYGGTCIECSECREKYVVQHIEDEKFCRNCGAKMDEVMKDE